MAFVVGTSGVIAMNASEYFEKYIADKMGLRPVFKMKWAYMEAAHSLEEITHEWEGKTIKGYEIKNHEVPPELEYPSEEEVDNYIRKREEYVADAILKHCGWEAFVKRCELCRIEDYIKERVPCEAKEGQCSMECSKFMECQMGKEVIPWAGREVYDGERRYL